MKIIKPETFKTVPMSQPLKSKATSSYQFIVVGDRCGIPVPHRFEQAMQTIASLPASFVVGVGDYVDGYWLNETDAHKEWSQVEEIIKTCEKPFLQTPGNHDYGNEVMRTVWHDRKGADYYALRYHQDLFCFVNSEDPSASMPEWIGEKVREISTMLQDQEDKVEDILSMIVHQMQQATPQDFGGIDVSQTLQPAISKEQVQFFQQVIAQHNDCRHIFIITHEPSWKCDYPPFMSIIDSCKDKSCTIFCGHLHDVDCSIVHGHKAIQLPQCGGIPHGHSQDGFLIVTVEEDLNFSLRGIDGTELKGSLDEPVFKNQFY